MLRFLLSVFLFCAISINAQKDKTKSYDFDFSFYKGTILEHNPDIAHLITDHPTGFIASVNFKTFGNKKWQQLYNYPDLGFSIAYQDLKNFYLGENYGFYGHYNFYFFKRKLQFRVAQGIALINKPYDRDSNFINNAYGSKLESSTYLKLNYKRNNIYKNLGFEAGFTIIHYSNASFTAPNNSTNTLTVNAGLNYSINYTGNENYRNDNYTLKYSEPIHYNFSFMLGANETNIIGLGKSMFYNLSAYADKRINFKSALQLGFDFSLAYFLKDYIKYQSVAFPEGEINGDEDFKRLGIFVGHELYLNKLSVLTQLGYYLYYPFEYQGRVYTRIGLKYHITKKWFTSVTVKSHSATAEGVEFGIGIRL